MQVHCELALKEKTCNLFYMRERNKNFLNLFWLKKGLARMPRILNLSNI